MAGEAMGAGVAAPGEAPKPPALCSLSAAADSAKTRAAMGVPASTPAHAHATCSAELNIDRGAGT